MALLRRESDVECHSKAKFERNAIVARLVQSKLFYSSSFNNLLRMVRSTSSLCETFYIVPDCFAVVLARREEPNGSEKDHAVDISVKDVSVEKLARIHGSYMCESP